MKSKKDWVSN